MFRRLYLLLFVSILALGTRAQSQLVFFRDSLIYTNVSIDSAAQVLTVTDSLRNLGGPTFNGFVKFSGYLNGGQPFFLDSVSVTNLDTTATNFGRIQVGVPVGTAAFVGGPNTLVIWPIYYQQPYVDSLHVSIYVTRALGIDQAPLAQMYLIQSGGNLNIQFGEAPNIVKQVSIYDLSGRMLYSGSEDQSHHIPVAGWSAGIYLCELQTYRGERRTIKFILQ